MWRSALIVATLLLIGAAQPGGIARQGLTEAQVRRLDSVQFAADCAVYMKYRADEEPASARGKAAAAARDDLYAITMSRNPRITPNGMEREAARAAGLVRERLISGALKVADFDKELGHCDQEFRLNVVRAWAIPIETGVLPQGPELYASTEFAKVCGGMYRMVAGRFTGAPEMAEAARLAEGPLTAEFARRSGRPYPEAAGLLRERAETMDASYSRSDGMTGDQVKFAVELCDQRFGFSVASLAQLRPVYTPKPNPTPADLEACRSLMRQTSADAEAAARELKDFAGGSPYLRAKVAGRLCGVYSDGHRLSKQMRCPQDVVDAMWRSRVKAEDTLAEFNSAAGKMRCERTQ